MISLVTKLSKNPLQKVEREQDMMQQAASARKQKSTSSQEVVAAPVSDHETAMIEETLAKIGKAPFVLVAESQNRETGLGSKMGTWLLERGFAPKFGKVGTWREGCGGLWEQMTHQGIDPDGILAAAKKLA